MGSGVARQCSGNRCLARWTVWIPPSWPPRRNRLSELEEKTWSRARSEVLVPYRFSEPRGDSSARRILEERFARGEIDADEFRSRLAALEGHR
jgi:hypothetical protein